MEFWPALRSSRRMAFQMNPKSTAQAPEVIQLNDSVYQLYCPAGTRSQQVVFFHGFQLEDYESAHTKTWTSGNGSVWPQTWLVQEFPGAHVLSVSYNRWVTSARDGGKMDLFNICENLTADLLSANRNEARCPIILVGHSFGGLVIKKLCVHVSNQVGCDRDSHLCSILRYLLDGIHPSPSPIVDETPDGAQSSLSYAISARLKNCL